MHYQFFSIFIIPKELADKNYDIHKVALGFARQKIDCLLWNPKQRGEGQGTVQRK